MKYKSEGFTLVEIIVSLAIFSIVAVVSLGALVKIISANKKAQSLQSAITNLNYAMESISREMRVGRKFYCSAGTAPRTDSFSGDACGDILVDNYNTGIVYFAFESTRTAISQSDGNPCRLVNVYRISFETSDPRLEKWKQTSCGEYVDENGFASIIDDEITLESAYVKLPSGMNPSIMTIRLSGSAGVRENEKTYFDVQTSISPRL